MGAQIPVIAEKPLSACVCKKFQLDALGGHLCTCTANSGVKKVHNWEVDQIADLFRTTHKVKTHQVVRSRGQQCGDIEFAGYLANEAGPVPLVQDLRIAHERFGVTDRFFAASGVQLAQPTSCQFHFRRAASSAQLKSKIVNILTKAAALRITLILDDTPVLSRYTHTHHTSTDSLPA
jgi:hypothetical protein